MADSIGIPISHVHFVQPVYAPNHRLHDAVKLFEGVIQGSGASLPRHLYRAPCDRPALLGPLTASLTDLLAESVAFSKDGSMVMLDKFGTVFRAASWTRVPERVTHLGVGRPLGSHFDSSDNLLICNPPVVGPVSSALDCSLKQHTRCSFQVLPPLLGRRIHRSDETR